MTTSISITDQEIFTALRTFLISVLPTGTEVVQAQDNLVSMPIGGFVAMNNVGSRRLTTNIEKYVDNGTNPSIKNALTPVEYTIQVDFYGAESSQWANIVQSLFRDEYATKMFPSEIQPLFADNPMQIPLIDGESNYTQRWKLTVVLQANQVINVSQDFASQLQIGLVDVDVEFHP